jgi:nitrite reductase/ring-hydroxylating ferredoxin subunit/uncharacterized membrane protein
VGTVVPLGSRRKDVLSGTWLGHPLHPPLTDAVIGAWTSALLLDLMGGERSRRAADCLVGAGVLAAIPTAVSGLSDWAELRGATRRIGSFHAIGVSAALVCHGLSLLARRSGRRRSAVALSALGYGLLTFSAWLGGHLSFRRGVGVNQTAFEDGLSEWTALFDEAELDLADGQLSMMRAGGVDVLLARANDRVYALANRCSHRGCGLHEGELRDETVICPCHGSAFRLDGTVARGPATAPQPTFDLRVRQGTIEIRRTSPS